jgi:hypothetical protein
LRRHSARYQRNLKLDDPNLDVSLPAQKTALLGQVIKTAAFDASSNCVAKGSSLLCPNDTKVQIAHRIPTDIKRRFRVRARHEECI